MQDKGATEIADRAVLAYASRNHGVFSVDDAESRGLNRRRLADRVARGRSFRLHRGVYSIVPPSLLKIEGRWLAAVLACGPGAALSHGSAAALWDMCAIGSGPVHVTVPTDAGRRKRPGIVIHRSPSLAGHTVVERGIPVTSSARTLRDIKRTWPAHRYHSALRRAEDMQLDTGSAGGEAPLFTELEQRFLNLCRRHSLPRPRTQQVIGAYTVDFVWPEERLIVEVDGWDSHGTRSAFEDDRARDASLAAQGYRVVRFTWRQVTHEGPWVARTVRSLLG